MSPEEAAVDVNNKEDVFEASFTCGEGEVVHGEEVEWVGLADGLKEGVEEAGAKVLALRAFEDGAAAVFVHGGPEVEVA